MPVDRRPIWHGCILHGPRLMLHLIFIGFKLDGELFATVTFTTSLWTQRDGQQEE